MAATAERLREVGRPYLFTPEKARKAVEKSNAVQAAKRVALKALNGNPAPALPQVQIVHVHPAQETPESRLDEVTARQLEIVREQVKRTRATLNDKKINTCPACERSGVEPHHRAQLLRSLDILLDRERKLLGMTIPGFTREGSERKRRGRSVTPSLEPLGHEPIEPAITPVAPAPVQPVMPAAEDKPGEVSPDLSALLGQIGAG